jgi:prepilin-type N-terminal cleavage/methylation domain-containing protein
MELKDVELNQTGVFIAQRGFTLVEIIVVMMILAILGSLAVPRYIDLESNAKDKAIIAAVAELNGRENLVWAKEKSSESGYIDDDETFSLIDINLGADYAWSVLPTVNGGSLQFKGATLVPLRRTPSVVSQPAFWNISTEPPPGDEGGPWRWWKWWR